MSSLIQDAVSGQRKAMEQLYEAAKRKTYFVAKSLLRSQNEAESACVWAFRNIWYELNPGEMETENDFTDLAVRRVVRYCKKQILRKNPKAYNMPFNRSFMMTGVPNISRKSGDDIEAILTQFTQLQRLIFVLDTAAGYDEDHIAKAINMDRKTVELALTAQVANIDSMLRALGKGNKLTYDTVLTAYMSREASVVIPERMETQVMDIIDRIAAPVEKKEKQKKIVMAAAAAVVVCVLFAVLAISLTGDNAVAASDDDASGTAAPTSATEVTDATDSTEDAEDTEDTTDGTVNTATGDGATLEEAVATHYATIEIADYGTITLELYGNTAPATVENFVALAESGFYDGLTFHRIIEGFMMQGGDPEGSGAGGSDTTITGEFSANGFENNLSHVRGVISMARSNEYDSASSQFFIVHEDSPDSLDGKYAAFGYVTEGIEVVDAICEAAEPIDSNGSIAADAQPVITAITITRAQ